MVLGAGLRRLSNCLMVIWRFLGTHCSLVFLLNCAPIHVKKTALLGRVVHAVIRVVELAKAVASERAWVFDPRSNRVFLTARCIILSWIEGRLVALALLCLIWPHQMIALNILVSQCVIHGLVRLHLHLSLLRGSTTLHDLRILFV